MIRKSTIARRSGAWGASVLVATILLSGCPAAREQKPVKLPPRETTPVAKPEPKPTTPPSSPKEREQPPKPTKEPAKSEKAQSSLTDEIEEMAEKPPELGLPLVDNLDNLIRLSGEQPIWIDKQERHVVLLGRVCKAGYPLEFFATYANRAYESVVEVNVKPCIIHTALLSVGAIPGHPARFQPEFLPPTGTEIAIQVRWKDQQGKVQSARAQDWVRDIKTKKALDVNWVFGGSIAEKDENGQIVSYHADGGDMICVLSLPTAMLDLPRRGYGAIESRSYEAFAERLPPEGTPVTLLLKPLIQAKPTTKPRPKKSAHELDAEKRAVEAADAWLVLVDQGQYARGWESAASYLKEAAERRDFVQKLGDTRKPLGAVKSRTLVSKSYTTNPPGEPEGQYVILRYKTAFERKAATEETITVRLEKDKKWRVWRYTIK
ncbi:MAG: DUF4019 domain-containing protein [Planctomycetaceae bacterium]|nr:DUF4019 domain-containing protein [Planctomycetaceae bacterium]